MHGEMPLPAAPASLSLIHICFSELGCYEFSIEDNGIGMTPEFQKIMFEPFSRADDHRTTKVQGTGLGMAIARKDVYKRQA